MRRVGQPARLDRRAELLGERERRVEAGPHARLDAALGADQLLRHAEPDALQVLAARRLIGPGNATRSSRSGPARPCGANSSAASVTSRASGPA